MRPPRQQQWRASIAWTDIQHVCLKIEEYTGSDSLYIFVTGREASYVIPLEGDSSDTLIDQLFTHQLVDAAQWVEAAASARALWG